MIPPETEVIRTDLPRGNYRVVLFDFDGTLSLIREGWTPIMVDMMVDELARTTSTVDSPALRQHVEDFVMALNGKPAIFQMARLVEEITLGGGTPQTADDYLREYDRRLAQVVERRLLDPSPADWEVPGARAMLQALRARGLKLYLASGTQYPFVQREAEHLGLTPYFDGEIHAPRGDDATFSKRAVIEKALRENNIAGEQLLSFGDGVVETQEVRRVGGTAIAVASHEPPHTGINVSKRDRLVAVGADAVIPHYRHGASLLNWLLGS